MTLSLAPGAMTRRLRAARLGVIRSYALAEGALRVYAYGTDEARAISAHLIQLGYDAAATGDRVTVTRPEPVEETADEVVNRILDENPSVARRVARAEKRAEHEEAATRRAVAEADLPPVAREEQVTVRIRARELRAGDLVVDSLGEHQYAAFDTDAGTHIRDGALVRVWTAIRDQERGLPPVLTVPAERELLVLRPMSEEGRELAARAGWL